MLQMIDLRKKCQNSAKFYPMRLTLEKLMVLLMVVYVKVPEKKLEMPQTQMQLQLWEPVPDFSRVSAVFTQGLLSKVVVALNRILLTTLISLQYFSVKNATNCFIAILKTVWAQVPTFFFIWMYVLGNNSFWKYIMYLLHF